MSSAPEQTWPSSDLVDARPDDELVRTCRGGEPAAFGVLAARHAPFMQQLAQRLLNGDHHTAEDVVQECLVKLHATLQRDERPLKVRAWLSVVVRNACMDEHRRRVPQPIAEPPDSAVLDEDPFDVDPHLDEAWAALPERFRTVLHHRELLGLSYEEIADAMDTSRSAVQTLLFRARAALRREYQRAGGSLLGCGAFGLSFLALVDGQPTAKTARLTAHLARCTRCQSAHERLDQLTGLLRTGQTAADGVGRAAPVAASPVHHAWAAVSQFWNAHGPSIAELVQAGSVSGVPLAAAALLAVPAFGHVAPPAAPQASRATPPLAVQSWSPAAARVLTVPAPHQRSATPMTPPAPTRPATASLATAPTTLTAVPPDQPSGDGWSWFWSGGSGTHTGGQHRHKHPAGPAAAVVTTTKTVLTTVHSTPAATVLPWLFTQPGAATPRS